jgi:hypothetical protein
LHPWSCRNPQTQVVAATPSEFEGVVRWRFESMAANRYRSQRVRIFGGAEVRIVAVSGCHGGWGFSSDGV